MSEITFDEFRRQMREKLDAFEAYWARMAEKNPEHFPMELFPGDWDSQFDDFAIEDANLAIVPDEEKDPAP